MKKKKENKTITLVKKLSFGAICSFLICVLLGASIGIGIYSVICKNDTFEIIGEKNISLDIGTGNYTYVEEGVKVISLGRDLSYDIIIDTNIDENTIDLTTAGIYYVKYTIDDIKYGSVCKVRTITVGEV